MDNIIDGKDYFDFPKPVDYVRQIIEQGIAPTCSKEVICIDFFGGSSTTAQAVMELSNVQKITSAENLRSRASDEIVPFREFIIKDDTYALL